MPGAAAQLRGSISATHSPCDVCLQFGLFLPYSASLFN